MKEMPVHLENLAVGNLKYKYIEDICKEFYDSFIKLNDYQKAAITNEDKAFLLNASVGSGKTTVLVNKVLYLGMVKKVPLSKMFVLTFTNKAADEIKQRVLRFAIPSDKNPSDKSEMAAFGTFHSVARYLLSNVLPVEDLGYTKDFSILDEDGAREISDYIIDKNGLNIKYRKKLEKRIYGLKHGRELYGNMKYSDDIDNFAYLLQVEKVKRNVMDFDDLIECCKILLRNNAVHPEWIIIDEFQDTDSLQLEMIDNLVGDNTHIFAVGDPNQIIYSWRGSREDIFEIFKERYDAKEATLPINYRSTATILGAARAFLSGQSHLVGIRGMGHAIVIKKHYNSFNEALYLAEKIKKLKKEGTPYNEIAILYRKQSHSSVFEDVFTREKIPYEVSVKKDLKDIPALYWFFRLIRASINNNDTSNILHVLSDDKYGPCLKYPVARQVAEGKARDGLADKIYGFRKWCECKKSADDFENEIYDYFDLDNYLLPTSISYSKDRDFILKYIKEISDYIKANKMDLFDGIKNAVDYTVLYGKQVINQMIYKDSDSVKLMTLHASKGLEFKYVFISGANMGIIPLSGRYDDEEEKRLFFVGITRAKDYLEISYHSNPDDGSALANPSPYLSMIPDDIIESEELKSRAMKLSDLKREIRDNMAKKGGKVQEKKKVIHPKYGEGYIVSEDKDTISAEFEGYGEKSFSKLFCPLKFIN